MLLQISNLYAAGISKLRRDSSWKDVKPAFTCDLWHSRCMKEYFTMTAHWIEIRGGELSPQWVLRQRVLGAFPVQDASIDHQGECQNMLNIQQLYPQWWINFTSYGNDLKSISVYMSSNVAYPFNAADYPFFGLCAQWLLAWLRNSWRCLVWMSPFLPLSPIVVQIWGRRSTTLSNGIGSVVDVIWSTMLSLPVLQHCGITRTIQPKLRPENVNKRLTGEKCELLLPSALPFLKFARNIWSWG